MYAHQKGLDVDSLQIRGLEPYDIPEIVSAYALIGWNNPVSRYERYVSEQASGQRDVLVAFVGDCFVGYLTIVWESSYKPFRLDGIPEVNDFSVLPRFRRQGVGSRLMDAAEQRIAKRSALAGIGVGMDPDYGPAQRLYTLRGYVADGRGLTSHGRPVQHGQTVTVDDGLVLYFTRELRP